MLERILDNYFINKIADYFIEYAKSIYFLDFKKRKGKNIIYIDVNYKEDDKKRLENYRKVISISKEDVIGIISDINNAKKTFRERIREVT